MNNRPARVINIVPIALGAIAVALSIGDGATRGMYAFGATNGSWSVNADNAETVRFTSPGANVDVVFGDVDEATLDASSRNGPVSSWRLERSGSAIEVIRMQRIPWVGDVRDDFSLPDWQSWASDADDRERAVLTLPAELEAEGLDSTAYSARGNLNVTGNWGVVETAVTLGELDLTGSATNLKVSIEAGEATLGMSVSDEVDLQVTFGALTGALTVEQPKEISAMASGAQLRFEVPAGTYAVTETLSVGESQVFVDDSSDADATIAVTVEVGTAEIGASN